MPRVAAPPSARGGRVQRRAPRALHQATLRHFSENARRAGCSTGAGEPSNADPVTFPLDRLEHKLGDLKACPLLPPIGRDVAVIPHRDEDVATADVEHHPLVLKYLEARLLPARSLRAQRPFNRGQAGRRFVSPPVGPPCSRDIGLPALRSGGVHPDVHYQGNGRGVVPLPVTAEMIQRRHPSHARPDIRRRDRCEQVGAAIQEGAVFHGPPRIAGLHRGGRPRRRLRGGSTGPRLPR